MKVIPSVSYASIVKHGYFPKLPRDLWELIVTYLNNWHPLWKKLYPQYYDYPDCTVCNMSSYYWETYNLTTTLGSYYTDRWHFKPVCSIQCMEYGDKLDYEISISEV